MALGLFVLALAWIFLSPILTTDAPASDSVLDDVAKAVGNPPGAFVLVHPPWRHDVVAGLEKRLAGLEVGPALPPDAMEGRRPVVAVLWPRAPGPGALRSLSLDREESVEGVTVRWLSGARRQGTSTPVVTELPGAGAWDLRSQLSRLQVRVTRAGSTVECNAWQPALARMVCPGMDEWNYVGMRVLPVQGEPRTCLWAHPVTGGTLSITAPAVPLGKTLRLGHALSDGAAGAEGAAYVDVKVTAAGRETAVRHPNAPGWMEDAIETPAGATADVRLDVTTPHDGARHFCLWLSVEP